MEKPARTLTGLDAEGLPALEETYVELQLKEEAEGVCQLCQFSPRGGRTSNSDSTTSQPSSSNSNNDSNNNHNKRTVTAHT